MPALSETARGYLYGLAAVALFGLTLPFTRRAVAELPPVFVGLGRSIVAALIAAVLLKVARVPLPSASEARRFMAMAAGVVVGFPLFSAIAMTTVPAAHGGVMLGILPLATAAMSVLFAAERPSLGFWFCGLAGASAVIAFSLLDGGRALYLGDVLLILAVGCAAAGYAIGGALSRSRGGWQVISWALVLSVPVLLPPVLWSLPEVNWSASPAAWLSFLYVAVFSQYLGFFFWNKGMALAGVAKVGQTQLLQVFVTLTGSAILLGETIRPVTALFAVIVVAAVAASRTMSVART
jgi:drug/metabolite transporter (DMT)-like permease